MYDCSKTHLNDALLSHIPATKEVTYKEPQPATSLTISQVTESLGDKDVAPAQVTNHKAFHPAFLCVLKLELGTHSSLK